MIDIRAEQMIKAINRLCNILERLIPSSSNEEISLKEVSFCRACGVLYSLKYGHYCAKNASPEER